MAGGMQVQMIGGKSPGPNDLVPVYECQWENCGFQFEELGDLIDHINQTSEAGSHCQVSPLLDMIGLYSHKQVQYNNSYN